MSTNDTSKKTPSVAPVPIESPLSIRDLTIALIKHYGLHEGHYDLLVEFRIAVGAIGPDPSSPSPGAMIGLSRVGLTKPAAIGPISIDAAAVNPAKRPSRKKSP